MNCKVGCLYKAVIEEDKFDLSSGDLVTVIGITDYGVRFVKHKNHNGTPYCWSSNLFEQDFIEFRTIDQGTKAAQYSLITAGEILTKLFENVTSSFSMRSAGPNRAERRRKKLK